MHKIQYSLIKPRYYLLQKKLYFTSIASLGKDWSIGIQHEVTRDKNGECGSKVEKIKIFFRLKTIFFGTEFSKNSDFRDFKCVLIN